MIKYVDRLDPVPGTGHVLVEIVIASVNFMDGTCGMALVPDKIDDRTAASVMQGLTASYFATDFYPAQCGDIALVHANDLA